MQITAANLEVRDGAELRVSALGIGNAGNVTLKIRETARLRGNFSSVSSQVSSNGKGKGGDVQILATNLEVLQGAQISASTFGIGDAGSVVLEISETAHFEGHSIDGNSSGAFSSVGTNGKGQGGDVQIIASNLEVINGAVLSASTFGIGNAGNVILEIRETAHFEGRNSVDGNPSGAFSSVGTNGKGRGGDIWITAGNLEVLPGAEIGAGTFGVGDAGNVILEIRETARFEGSVVFSNIASDGQGQGKNVQITAGSLEVLNGGQILASTLGTGDAGNVILDIREIARFEGRHPINGGPSGAFSLRG
ncbi:MAG: hypothetical protein F6K19_50235 [Cyanothece sp. SIO1E1]|nr:hypothetical protein [Cyanothece sp. SIO1E1]